MKSFLLLGLACLPLPAAAGPAYFNESYGQLQKKACALAAQGSRSARQPTDQAVRNMVFSKTNLLNSFYSLAGSYGRNDIPGAALVLRNEVRLNWNIKQINRARALEALYASEASIKFFLERDRGTLGPKSPALSPDFEKQVPALVGQAEEAFAAGRYADMRRFFYHAIWIAYPVTSRALFLNP